LDLIILGASARAAAFSAHRAGMRPWCVDLFADADLTRRFPACKVPLDAYPHALIASLKDAPDGPVIYTGGLENHPGVIARIDRPVWGNPPEVLRRVRSPFLLADVLREYGMPTLALRADPPSAGDERQWLLKPLRGSGGVGIRRYTGRAFFDPRTHYLQEYSPGKCFGAVLVGLQGRAILIGVTRLIYSEWLHAPPFHYAGSLLTAAADREAVQRIGDVIAARFSLRGVFGVDLVRHPKTQDFRVLEVNPRYTASVEVFERAYGRPLLDLHRAAFEDRHVDWHLPAPTVITGKAILYAREALTIPTDGPWPDAFTADPARVEYADIPHAGEAVPRGRPVLTLFADGATDGECLAALRRKAETLDRWLWG
jgi:predicted ATP-grasp superfamily ATP-dependent carboligase